MQNTSPQLPLPVEIYRILRGQPRKWIVPAVAVALLVGMYALVRPDTWVAAQALVVRDEAVGAVNLERPRPGQFPRIEQMTAKQKTILELLRGPELLRAVLEQAGHPDGKAAPWPTAADVDRFRRAVKLVPPKGAEFGETEVFYLQVKDHDRERAILLAGLLCERLEASFQHLRKDKAESMIGELQRSVALSQSALDEVTDRLARIESEVGVDLAELRILHKSPSGDSDLRKKVHFIENELRTVEADLAANGELRRVLAAAEHDPGHLLATPNRLLESQPALRRLKDGLLDAQLTTARLLGSMSAEHPQVLGAQAAERAIAEDLHRELEIAIRGVDIDVKMNENRVAVLQSQLDEAHTRLGKLAGVRARYAMLLEEIANRNKILQAAEQNLADARGSQIASHAASLISRIGGPDTGSKPAGPGRLVLCLAGIGVGLLIGAGYAVLTAETAATLPVEVSNGCRRSPAEQPARQPTAVSSDLSFTRALFKVSRRK